MANTRGRLVWSGRCAGAVVSFSLRVGEALDDLELFLSKPRKTLSAPIGERHHDLYLLRRSHFDRSLPQCDVGSSLRFSKRVNCRSNGKVGLKLE